MTKGKRNGFVTKAVLIERLCGASSGAASLDLADASARVILGHAVYHKVVTSAEVDETVDRQETTTSCYLYTHIEDPLRRVAIDEYVVASSQLYRRGTIIANLKAMHTIGSTSDTDRTSQPCPRFDPALQDQFGDFADAVLGGDDIRNSAAKQVFLPERWPSATVPRDAGIQVVLDAYGDLIPSLPDWSHVMKPTGWDNAINRMATKFLGNIKVHAQKNIVSAVLGYLEGVSLHDDGARSSIVDVVKMRLRPLAIHDDDMAMVLLLRKVLGVQDDDATWYTPKEAAFSRDLLSLHLFLVRYGANGRSYLPVASRGRKYCYLDTKIATSLFAEAGRRDTTSRATTKKRCRSKVPRDPDAASTSTQPVDDDESPPSTASVPSTVSVGDLLGITDQTFNARRKALRKTLCRQYRKRARSETPGRRKKRLERLARRWGANGNGHLRRGSRIDSVETDGVGLRLCVKTPIDLSPFIVPVPLEPATEASASAPKKRKRSARQKQPPPPYFDAVDPKNRDLPAPIIVALDNGRAKLFSAAISSSAIKKPTSMAFTRRRYYFEMGHQRNRRWELERTATIPLVAAALVQLSSSGGLRNCDLQRWQAYLTADRANEDVLHAEYVVFKERALWRMRMFRWKRRSLDRATQGLLSKATRGERVERPLVFAMGDAGFASTGPGELPAPTAAITVAFRRALARVSRGGRKVVVFSINEFRTTMCCCACGSVTHRPQVDYQAKDLTRQRRASHRLRACTMCETTGKLRDRDVQAARNIAWLAYNMYYGLERPGYLRRGGADG